MNKEQNDRIIKIVLAHRYLYYVIMRPIISDREYDALERVAVESAPEDNEIHSPGSSLGESYSDEIKAIAYEILNRHNAKLS